MRSAPTPAPLPLEPPVAPLDGAVARAADALAALQQPDGHWVFPLESDATIPAEYLLLCHYLGEAVAPGLEAGIGRYLRRRQGGDGGWPLFHDGAADLSATIKAYFALKMIGDDPAAPHMARARHLVGSRGGAGRANVFTRILLALFGELPWSAVPSMPVELILLPRWSPIHIGRMSYWSRTVLVPLLVLQALRPRARNPRRVGVPELASPAGHAAPGVGHRDRLWAGFFDGLDRCIKRFEPYGPERLRERAIDECRRFVSRRLNGRDGLGAIFPAMANAVMMFDALGLPSDHPDRAMAREALDRLLIRDGEEVYCQPCVSPVWDTALAAHALLEAGGPAAGAARRGLDWLLPRQVRDHRGDWGWSRPRLHPGGWAFQYANPDYPDLDDTAVVAMALDRARRKGAAIPGEPAARARAWIRGMQCRDGGWGAFDADNDRRYLNSIPFADHGALLDPPTADVTARCIGVLAQLGHPEDRPAIGRAVAFLLREQRRDGSWYGRWGVNHLYGTWSALAGLRAAGETMAGPAVARGRDWLLAVQGADGGWGEACESYAPDRDAFVPSPSTPSQTAWALLGLMAAGSGRHPAVARGVDWLLQRQDEAGLWAEASHTGTGLPGVFYLRYHGYPKFFPLWALARYRNLRGGATAAIGL